MSQLDNLKKLRDPFPPNQISKLPKPTKAQTDAVKNDYKAGVRCQLCGTWHHPQVIHLDYVGHAALTDRLLDVDPEWNWEPLTVDPVGLPQRDQIGGLWIKLTVCGVTRLGYGSAEGKTGGDAIKELIGDALRNAAMRFGAALDLWHKGNLHEPCLDAEPTDTANANQTKEWNEGERHEAKVQIGALADDLMEWGVEPDEIEKLVSKPRLLIGDETVDFDRWANRLMGLHDRLEKKYKKEVPA